MIEKLINKLSKNSLVSESFCNELIIAVFFEGNSKQFDSKQKEIEKFFSDKKIKAQENTSDEQVKDFMRLAVKEAASGTIYIREGVCFFVSDEEFKFLLDGYLDVYDFLQELFSAFEEVKNITNFITFFESNKSELKRLFLKIPKKQLLNFINFYDKNEKKFITVAKQIFGVNKLDKEILNKFFTTSKQNISDEFLIDKKTLNKWLQELFGNRFSGRKKIYLPEYIEIYNTLIDEPKEYLDIVDFPKILKRIHKGMSFNKTFIAFLTNFGTENDKSTLLKIQKEGLNNFPIYNSINKFPYSLMRKLTVELGEELDF